MLKAQKKMDIISNNLANASTTGFKKDLAVSQTFPEMLTKRINDLKNGQPSDTNIGNMSLGSDVVQVFTDYTQGRLIRTDNPTDISFKNSNTAFFAVSVPQENGNEEMYTRDGSWTIDEAGYLVTKDGYQVLGENGPIYLASDNFSIQEDGNIYINNEYIDRLRIRDFTDTSVLQKYGNNLVQAPEDAQVQPFNGQIVQGFIESSNINTVQEMVEMINVIRSYEANQKIIKGYDDTLDKVINQVGRT
jgi:flagellar basal-body rod protein FlgG